jgi:NAD(P)H-hydrate epimerase
MRKIEAAAVEEMGIPTILMMENAAIGVMKHCLAFLGTKTNPKVMIAAGAGSNGGDGLALARQLHLRGIDLGVIFVGDMSEVRGDALLNLEIAGKLGIPIKTIPLGDNLLDVPYTIETCDLVVDALLGTGLNRAVEGSYEYIIDMINGYAKHVISVDIPSGIHADTGQVMGTAVKANQTVTLGCPKTGLMIHPGAAYAGEVLVAEISLPHSLLTKTDVETFAFTDDEIPALLPNRDSRSHKGSFGRVYAFAGSSAMPGAAAIASAAAYKSGAGLVYACAAPDVTQTIQRFTPEVIACLLLSRGDSYPRKNLDAILEKITPADVVFIGPGLGRGPGVSESVMYLLENVNARLVIDADAINAVAENVNILKNLKHSSVITPHPGEMSRLTGLPVQEILQNTMSVAAEFAREFEVTTVLKDARTIVASPSGHTYINTTGCSALAKGGSGDALTGLIAGLAAQGMDTFNAAALGTYIHGKAGEQAAGTLSHYGVMASDVVAQIPDVLARYEKYKKKGCQS